MRYAWATREPDRAAPFLAALAPLGLTGLAAPLTAIVPVADLTPLDAALASLQPGEVVALASAHATELVAARLAALPAHAHPPLSAITWWAVGESSAAPLRSLGLAVSVAPRSSAVGLAEAILATSGPSAAASSPLRVLLPRAEDGRDEAALALRAAGARVDELVIYRSAPLPLQTPALAAALSHLRAGGIPVVALFAPSQVTALVAALTSIARPLAACSSILFAAIGDTTARALSAAGAAHLVVASAPTPEAMANAVASRYSP